MILPRTAHRGLFTARCILLPADCSPLTAYRAIVMRNFLPLIVLAAAMAGCGYKTPLVYPKPKPEAQQPAPQTAQQPDAKKAEESKKE